MLRLLRSIRDVPKRMQPGRHGAVVLVAPSTFVAQAAQRWFGAKEAAAAQV